MDYSIRPVSLADGPAITTVFNYFVINSFASYSEKEAGPDFFERFYRMCLNYPFYVIETDSGDIIGFGCIHPFHIADTFRRTAEVTYFILPEHTGSGLGSQLLDLFYEFAQENNIVTFVASISSKNEQSIKFHEKHGFKTVGRMEKVGIKHNQEFDMIWMQKFL